MDVLGTHGTAGLLEDRRAVAREAARARYEALFRAHFAGVYRMVFSLGVEQAEIEDVVQRAFCVAHRRLSEQLEVAHPGAWIRGIALRVVQQHRRWRRVRQLKSRLLQATAEATAEVDTPEELVAAAEARQRVRGVLARLRPKLRDVLVLTDLEEIPPREVARMLDLPHNTVRSRRRLARQQFERLWAGQESQR